MPFVRKAPRSILEGDLKNPLARESVGMCIANKVID